jgi:hypothetical protein
MIRGCGEQRFAMCGRWAAIEQSFRMGPALLPANLGYELSKVAQTRSACRRSIVSPGSTVQMRSG